MTVDLHSLVGPYALNALEPDERTQFEAHLEHCADCRAELAGFQATAARLGEAEGQSPPSGLRDRLLAMVSATPQERPVTSVAQKSRLRRALPRLAVAAAFLVGAVGVGGYLVERDEANDARSRTTAITSVLAAKDATTTSKVLPGGGNLQLISSTDKDAAVILARGLPTLRGGKVYQVWVITGESPTSQGVFQTGGAMLMKGVTKADSVAVTIEPEGGSKKPTTEPIAVIPV